MSSYEKDRAQTMRDNKRKLYDLNLLLKFEDSEMAKDYDRVDEPLDKAKFQIGVEVGMLVEDSKRWVVGKISNMKHQAAIWAKVPKKPKSKAKPKEYVVTMIGSEEADYTISYCFVKPKIK